MRRHYRNITVNLAEPTTRRDQTAVVILDVLRADPHREVFSHDLDVAVERELGDTVHIDDAVKALRNLGHPLYCTKARQLSWWTYAADDAQYAEYSRRVMSETYSQVITVTRALSGAMVALPNNPMIVAVHSQMRMAAINVGQWLGIQPQQVIYECDPLKS